MRGKGYRERVTCSLCGGRQLKTALDLGATPIANEYAKSQDEVQETFPLNVVVCSECGHSQLGIIVDPERLFGDYAYATATSPITVGHVHDEAEWIKHLYEERTGFSVRLDEKSLAVEIGSNDGTMCRTLKRLGVGRVVGVDPAASKLVPKGEPDNVYYVSQMFHHDTGSKIRDEFGAADVVIANNVLAHVPSVSETVLGIRDMLTDGGLFVFEVSYLMDLAEEPLFDTVYHEHTSYHTLKPLALMLDKMGLPIVSAMRIPGQRGRGSLRVACVKGRGKSIDAWSARVLMKKEATLGLWTEELWRKSVWRIEKAKDDLRQWIDAVIALGSRVVGYGAPAKLTTLTYALKIGRQQVEFVVDDSPWKQGLYTPGTLIPIRHPDALKDAEGATCIIFAWNFAGNIVIAHKGFRGTFVVPLPELKEVNPSDWRSQDGEKN